MKIAKISPQSFFEKLQQINGKCKLSGSRFQKCTKSILGNSSQIINCAEEVENFDFCRICGRHKSFSKSEKCCIAFEFKSLNLTKGIEISQQVKNLVGLACTGLQVQFIYETKLFSLSANFINWCQFDEPKSASLWSYQREQTEREQNLIEQKYISCKILANLTRSL